MSSPIVTVNNKSVFLNSSIAAADLFTASDSDDAIVSYFVQDFGLSPTGGYFALDGVAIPQGSFFKVIASDLAKLTYVAGSQIGFERFRVMARDAAGNFSSALTIGNLYSVRANTTAPFSKAITFTLLANETKAGSQIVWGYDPDGFPIQTFHIRDRSVDLGFFEFDGVAKTQNVYFSIAAADIGKLRYVTTGKTSSELFDVIANDGAQNSLNSVGFANTLVNANSPVGLFTSASVLGTKTLQLAGVPKINDADGSTIKKYRFYNTSPHLANGELVFKGVVQPRLRWIEVDAAQIDQIHFRPANKDFTQEIRFMAFDGRGWSAASTLAISSIFDQPIEKPVYKPNVLSLVSEQLRNVSVSSLFDKIDGGPFYTSYEIYDPDIDPARGYFAVNGIPLTGGQIITQPASVFENSTTFYTGAFYDRALDTIYVRANNGSLIGDWEKLDIVTVPEIEDVLVSGSDWNGLLPRNSLGQMIITFSFMQQFPDYATGEAIDGDPAVQQHFEQFNEQQRVNARLAFRHIEKLINVQMLEVADTSTNVFGGKGGIVRMGEYGLPFPTSSAAAFAFFPGFGDPNGDMWFNRLNMGGPADLDFTPGTFGYKVFLHEFGHAMGLKHPHDGTPRLPIFTVDVNDFTVMSYQPAQNGEPTTYQLYDVATLQALYGANNTYNTGDNTYSLANTWNNNPFVVETIWDAGGNDTLSAFGAGAAVVDLRAGQQSTIGTFPQNITIALDVVIENALGSSFADQIFGNAVANNLDGRDGNDYLFGGTGNDTNTGGAGNDIIEFGVADGFDIIDEKQLGGLDTLRISPFPGLETLAGDFEFRLNGSDLIVDLKLDDQDSQGMVRIKNQSQAGYQIETLELNGLRIDLESLTSQVTPTIKKFAVLTTTSTNGFLVAPL